MSRFSITMATLLAWCACRADASVRSLTTVTDEPAPSTYIVAMRRPNGRASEAARMHIEAELRRMDLDTTRVSFRASVLQDLPALDSFVVELTPDARRWLGDQDIVDNIELDQEITIDPPIIGETRFAPQELTELWNLDRVDQNSSMLDGQFDDSGLNGTGVHIYIIDTGVRQTHGAFQGRTGAGFDFVDQDTDADDCNGHGTHCAGTALGSVYGVATGAIVHAVRVLSCSGSGTLSGVVAGMNWVIEEKMKHQYPAVIASMSLGGSFSASLNAAAKAMVDAKIVTVVAAGNSNDDAKSYSPASAEAAITVGSTQQGDTRSSFSNFGPVVDIFAPGSQILSAWIGSDTATKTISGTSMATPLVAGVAAGIAQKLLIGLSETEKLALDLPAVVREELVGWAQYGAMQGIPSGTPNCFLQVVPFQKDPLPPTPTPAPTPVPAPTLAPTPPTCAGNCGKKAGTCWCDTACTKFGDCCPDYQQFCAATTGPTPAPTNISTVPPTPTPSSSSSPTSYPTGYPTAYPTPAPTFTPTHTPPAGHCVTLYKRDLWGDDWGVHGEVRDGINGTLLHQISKPNEGKSSEQVLCFKEPSGCYTLTMHGGPWQYEVEWALGNSTDAMHGTAPANKMFITCESNPSSVSEISISDGCPSTAADLATMCASAPPSAPTPTPVPTSAPTFVSTLTPTAQPTPSPSAAPTPESKKSKTCSQLGWKKGQGSEEICGASKIGSGKQCSGAQAYPEALAYCEAVGARLCTSDELEADETRGTGCGYDKKRIWSSTSCTDDNGHTGYRTVAGSTKFKSKIAPECFQAGKASGAYTRCCASFTSAAGTRRLRGAM